MLTIKKSFLIILCLSAVLTVWLVSKLEYWTIEDFIVYDNFFVTEERILQRSSTENYGDNILYYPRVKVIKRIINEVPQVDRVMIKKNIFKKQIEITVIEKEPFINIIFYPNYYVVSEEGVILNVDEQAKVFDPKEIMELPILTGIKEEVLVDRVSLPDEYAGLLSVMLKKFLNFFPKESLKLDVSSKKEIVLMTGDLFDIKIGGMERIEDKLEAFKILYNNIKERKDQVIYIDVRFPDYPVVRYAK